jgi:hypothetical protein
VEDYQMVIDREADQEGPAASDVVDRPCRVALPERQIARSKKTDNASGFMRGW